MKKIRHSKVKNTGILFELLVRQITADTLNNVSESHAGKLIRKYFHKSAPLSKELGLYQTLVNEKFNSSDKAESLYEAVIQARKKLSNKILVREKYNLVSDIKKYWNIEDFFNARISEYKVLASIYNLFEYEIVDNPKKMVENKFTLLEHITTNKPVEKVEQDPVMESYEKADADIRALAYKLMIEKFNKKYDGLSTDQKQLLQTYITHVSNTPKLKEHLSLECIRLTKQLKTLGKQVDDKPTQIKLTEATNLLRDFNKKKVVDDTEVLALLKFYELKKELKKALGDK